MVHALSEPAGEAARGAYERAERRALRLRGAASGTRFVLTFVCYGPDLILADFLLPEMDGFAFSRLVQARQRVPVMLVSVLKKQAEAVLRGVAGYVQKPILAAERRSAVDRIGHGGNRPVAVADPPVFRTEKAGSEL